MKLLTTIFKSLAGLLVAAVLALAIVMAIIGRENTWAVLFGVPQTVTIDFANLPPSMTANSFLLCPSTFCRTRPPDRESPKYGVTPDILAALVRRIVESTEGIRRDDRERQESTGELVTGEQSQKPPARQWNYIATSRYLKFPDLVTIRILDLGEGRSSLAIYSRAVYGRRDFGVNQNRVASWVEAIEVAVARASLN